MAESIRCAVIAAALASLGAVGSAGAQKTSEPTGWVGLSVTQNARAMDGSDTRLAYPVVASVDAGSPAKSAGLVAGDTILAYNDIDANSSAFAVKRFLKPGTELRIKIRRNGVRSLTLKVAKRTDSHPYGQSITMTSSQSSLMQLVSGAGTGPIAIVAPVAADRKAPFAGAYFARLNAGLASALSVPPSGVLVVDVGNGSNAMEGGLRAGDVITRADSIAVESALGIMTALRLASGQSMTLEVLRHGKPQKLTINW
ncbi:MAG: PDZ domain-containing protein [Gemmatimonadaceae bacterium]